MKIGALTEVFTGENRVAMTPDSALQLQKLGHECFIESGAGAKAGFSDAAYEAAGVKVVKTAAALFKDVDVIAKEEVGRQPAADARVSKCIAGKIMTITTPTKSFPDKNRVANHRHLLRTQAQKRQPSHSALWRRGIDKVAVNLNQIPYPEEYR